MEKIYEVPRNVRFKEQILNFPFRCNILDIPNSLKVRGRNTNGSDQRHRKQTLCHSYDMTPNMEHYAETQPSTGL
ncbi:hypothetical protein [Ulvibacterium marinum]|uniref:hypothetical protein n=1 Tax=Ulvibacterium marinum TaxID=2419782 RepID=UPI00131466C4|nr:hypothetical protein [Ulvibacterium marinum]